MEIDEYLRHKGIKVTKGRVNVLDILSRVKDAVDVEHIFNKCKDRNIRIDLSTIYRTLELFENKGIISKFDLGQGKYSYMIKKEHHKHILQCRFCHREVEIDCPMEQVKEIIRNKTGFVFLDEELDLKLQGVCEECSKGDEIETGVSKERE